MPAIDVMMITSNTENTMIPIKSLLRMDGSFVLFILSVINELTKAHYPFLHRNFYALFTIPILILL